MAVALRGAAVIPTGGQANPTTGYTCTIPAQVVENDLLFLTLTSRDSTGAGSIAVSDNEAGSSWTNFAHSSTNYKLTLWWRRATSATASKTLTVSGCVGSCAGVLKCFSGASLDAQPWADVAFETNAAGDETHTGFTPSTPNAMVCCAIADYGNDDAISVGPTFATLGATTMTQCLSTGGSDCANTFGHKVQTGGAASATGNLTWSQADNTTYSVVWTIKVNNHAATGVLAGAAGVLAATAARSHSVAHPSTGVLTGPAGVLAGTVARRALHGSTGVLTGAAGALAGAARRDRIHQAYGNLRPYQVIFGPAPLPSIAMLFGPYATAQLAGTATHQAPALEHVADGALTGTDGLLAGAAARVGQHPSDGVLTGSEGVLSGSAARLGQYAADGVLTGSGAILAGTASHVVGHAADGALTGPEAVLTGEALRLAAGIVGHSSAGALAGAAGELAGEAVRQHLFDAVGVLVGAAGLVAGKANVTRAHEAAGELVGAAALLAGAAARPASAVVEGQIGGFYLPPGLLHRRLRITIRNGNEYEIEDLDAAEAVLAEVKTEVERKVRRRVQRKPSAPPAAAVPEVTVTGPPDLMAAIAPRVYAIETAARDYAAAESRALLQRILEQDDEDVLLLT